MSKDIQVERRFDLQLALANSITGEFNAAHLVLAAAQAKRKVTLSPAFSLSLSLFLSFSLSL